MYRYIGINATVSAAVHLIAEDETSVKDCKDIPVSQKSPYNNIIKQKL